MKINYEEDMDELWTFEDLQKHLKLSENTCKKLLDIPTFPYCKIGKGYRIPKRLYFKWLGEQINNQSKVLI